MKLTLIKGNIWLMDTVKGVLLHPMIVKENINLLVMWRANKDVPWIIKASQFAVQQNSPTNVS